MVELEEVLAAVAAGILVGIVLALIERQFPTSGIGRI